MKNIWNLSTIVIIAVFALLVTVFIIMLPFTTLFQDIERNFLDYVKMILGFFGFLFVFIIFYLLKQKDNRKAKRNIGISRELDIATIKGLENYEDLVKNDVKYRVYGSKEIEDNENAEIEEIDTWLINETSYVIISPSFLARFKKYPEAFATVLYHELAHVYNKDNLLLFELKRFLSATISVFIVYFFISYFNGVVADGFSFESAYSNIIGKSYNLFSVILVTFIFLLQKKITELREALADKYAIEKTNLESKEKADSLIKSAQTDIIQSSKDKIENSLTLTPFWIISIGFIISAFNYRFNSQFAYLESYLLTNPRIINFFQIILDFSFGFLYFLGFFYVLNGLLKNYVGKKSKIYTIGINAIFLLLGSTIYFLLFESLPLALPAWFMSTGYDYVVMVDPFRALIVGIALQLLNSVLICPIISVYISINTKKAYYGILFGLFWHIMRLVELHYFPKILDGYLSLIMIALILFSIHLLIRPQRRPNLKIMDLLPISFILILSGFHLFGFGDLNYYAKLNNKIGVNYIENNEPKKAEKYFLRAINYGRSHTQLYFNQAISLIQQDELRKATVPLTIAANSIYEYSWKQKFKILSNTGAVYLNLRDDESDFNHAEKYFQKAEYHWRNNSRLPLNEVASLLYNIACLKAVYENNLEESVLYLFEALAIDQKTGMPQLSSAFIDDPDLRILSLNTTNVITQMEWELLENNIKTIDVISLKELIDKKIIKLENLIHYLAFLYQQELINQNS